MQKLRNLSTGEVFIDVLHAKALEGGRGHQLQCPGKGVCGGSSMTLYGQMDDKVAPNPEDILGETEAFIRDFYKEYPSAKNALSLEERLEAVKKELAATDGIFELTDEELDWACVTAWRNAPRCPGRIQWRNLKVFDCRKMTRLEEVFEACCRHIEYSTNGGNIRPAITVFPPRRPGHPDVVRIWNQQFIQFAGYKIGEGDEADVIGDKLNVKFTEFCESLGWKGKRGRFDVLPLILSGSDGEPHVFRLPEDIILKVNIEHPSDPNFADLGLQWFALPAVSGMMLDIGGLQFPASPFSGWYSLPEVATRDLLDKQRYDLMDELGEYFGLDTSTNANMWRDRVNAEVNEAVLYSYNKTGVSMVDQVTQAEQFMTFFKDEHKRRGGCPSDWVWIVPPESGSLTPVFHQEMLNYQLKPMYGYQPSLMDRYNMSKRNMSLSVILKAMLFVGSLLKKQIGNRRTAEIFYGTETGTSERFSQKLKKLLSSLGYNAILRNCAEFDLEAYSKVDSLVFFVVSTFGSGEPPNDSLELARQLEEAVDDRRSFSKMRFGVFALGSKAYPDFCAFGKSVEKSLVELKAKKMVKIGMGDELSGQEESFNRFLSSVKNVMSSDSTKGGSGKNEFDDSGLSNDDDDEGIEELNLDPSVLLEDNIEDSK